MRLDPSLAVQLAIPIVLAAVAWGAAEQRNDGQDKDIAALERAIERERAERLAYQQQQEHGRMLWMLQRSGRRLDPALAEIATTGARPAP